MNPIPVTFHVRAEPRPEFIEDQIDRVRPYSAIVRVVAVLAVIGVGFGYIMSAMMGPQQFPTVMKSASTPTVATAPPVFDIWQPPTPRVAVFEPAGEIDRTPVASLPVASIPVPRTPQTRGFAPVERAPDYSGFKVIAGH